jgi:hypothetical protein
MYLSKEEFVRIRIDRVKEQASLYDIMAAGGSPPRFRDRSAQMRCVFQSSHAKGTDRKPSARYYPKGERDDYETFYCFYCTERPLDVIGFLQRQRGIPFMQALRELEQKHNIRYDDIEIAPDVGKELEEAAKQKSIPDAWKMLRYAEELMDRHRDTLGMTRFVRLAYLLDVIYFKHDKDNPAPTLTRLDKWRARLFEAVGLNHGS